MGNTSLTVASSPSAIPAVENAGTRNTSVDEPPYTVVQKNGVEVAPFPSTLELDAYPNSEEGENAVLIKGIDFQKNSVDLIDKEPSSINLITNCPVIESPANTLEITDIVIKKNGTSIMTGPKQINFTNEVLVTEDTQEVSVNLAGKGFFGDGSDGDYTLDGTQAAVSGLFSKASAEVAKDISSIVPLIVTEELSAITGDFYASRQSYPLSAIATVQYIVINISMNSGFAAGDVGQIATIDSTYLDSNGVENRQSFSVTITRVNSASQIECETVSPSSTLLNPISPYRTETVYSLTVGVKSSTAQGTLLRPSEGYIALNSSYFTADSVGRFIYCTVAAVDYVFRISSYINSTTVTVSMLSPRETVSSLSINGFTLKYSNITENFVETNSGDADLVNAYAKYELELFGLTVNTSAVVVFSSSHGFSSDDLIRISGVTGIPSINKVWRIISLESNIVVLHGYTFSDVLLSGAGGTAIKLVDYTLSRDAFFGSLTIADNARLCTNNYRLFVKDTLTIEGALSNNGAEAGTTGYFPAMGTGGNGGRGGITAFPTPENGVAGSNGAAQTNPIFNSSDELSNGAGGLLGGTGDGSTLGGGTGGAGGSSGTSTKITEPYTTRINLISGNCFSFAGTTFRIKSHASSGGGGGGGVGGYYSISYNGGVGGAGGRGGNNGGYLLVCAGSIFGSGIICSFGERGANGVNGTIGQIFSTRDKTSSGSGGGGSGGGGGAGGIIVIMSRYTESTISKSVLGGVGGKGGYIFRFNPVGSPVSAPSGGNGYIGRTGITYEFTIT